MRIPSIWLKSLATLTLSVATFTAPALAQEDYPTKPIRLVVPWAPGGSADIIARILTEPMASELGQAVIVENLPGAGGTLGSAEVARSAPDGYTLLMGNVGSQAIAPSFLSGQIPYDVMEDFTPITEILEQPNVLLVSPQMEAETLDELVAYIKENPGTPYATPGVGNSPNLTGEFIKNQFGLEMTVVPYDSGAEVNNALGSGQIMIAINNMPEAMAAIRNGTAKPIAITSAERSEYLPDVPTFVELGASEIVVTSWQALFGPAGMNEEIVTKLQQATAEALKTETAAQRNEENGSTIVASTPEEAKAFVAEQLELWAKLVAIAKENEAQ